MARYNSWQNKGLRRIVEELDEEALWQDRGAFFGSILGTLNHLLWGDMRWIARLDGKPAEAGAQTAIADSPRLTPSKAEWARLRFLTDGRIREWALGVDAVDLVGTLELTPSGAARPFTMPIAIGVMQLFNHQTHHRGQVHAMLTSIGKDPGVTDLPFLPEEF